MGLSPLWLLPSSWLQGQCLAPLSSWHTSVSPPFSCWTLGPVCPQRPRAAPWRAVRRAKPQGSHGMLGGAPRRPCLASACARSWSLCCPVDTMAMGWRRATAAAPQWRLQLRIIQNTFDAKSLRELWINNSEEILKLCNSTDNPFSTYLCEHMSYCFL